MCMFVLKKQTGFLALLLISSILLGYTPTGPAVASTAVQPPAVQAASPESAPAESAPAAESMAEPTLNIAATSLVPGEESRYTLSFSPSSTLNLPASYLMSVRLPQGFSLIKGNAKDADPGCTLASVRYKKAGDKYYSLLQGNTTVTEDIYGTTFTLEISNAADTIDPSVEMYLILPGVLNASVPAGNASSPEPASVSLSLSGNGDTLFNGKGTVVLGQAPGEAPDGLILTPHGSGQIDSVWEAVYGATRYRLYYAMDPNGYYMQACDNGQEPAPGEEWQLTETGCSFVGTGNGGLLPGRTYYFKVQAGNEYGFGPFSATKPVTTSVVKLSLVRSGTVITVIADQAIILRDADKIQVYDQLTGNPVDKNVVAAGDTITVTADLAPGSNYQVVFYEQAVESAKESGVINALGGWSFTADRKGHSDHSRSGNGTSAQLPLPPAGASLPGTPAAFRDIQGHWAQSSIERMAGAGYLRGTGDGLFAPDRLLSKGEWTLILARFFSLPEPSASLAASQPVTREEAAQMLFKAWKDNDRNKSGSANTEESAGAAVLQQFSDQNQISAEAVSACSWAAENGLIKGFPDGRFKPKAHTTRAEAGVILSRLTELFGQKGVSNDER